MEMDWNRAVEKNREALKRILAALVAMAGLTGAAAFTSPLWGFAGRVRQAAHPESEASGGGDGLSTTPTRQPDDRRPPHKGEVKAGFSSPPAGEDGSARQGEAEPPAEPGEGCRSPALTLPRHLYRTILRLLRPAESAVRRLIIVAARGLVVEPPPPARVQKPDPKATQAAHAAILRSLGLAVVLSPADLARAAAAARRAAARRMAARPRCLNLALIDPLKNPLRRRSHTVAPHQAPRILSLDGPYHRLPPPPAPHDPIDATRIAQRLAVLAHALDDLPGQALRFARWRAAREAEALRAKTLGAQHGRGTRRFSRSWPLRPGLPPGQTLATHRRPRHELHELLRNLQGLACWALEPTDTS